VVTLTTSEATALYRWLYRSPMPRGPDYPYYRVALDKLEQETLADREKTDGKTKC